MQGVLSIGTGPSAEALSMVCEESPDGTQGPGADQNASLWNCQEYRGEGRTQEGLKTVKVYRQGNSAVILAKYLQAKMFPLSEQEMGSMSCKEVQDGSSRRPIASAGSGASNGQSNNSRPVGGDLVTCNGKAGNEQLRFAMQSNALSSLVSGTLTIGANGERVSMGCKESSEPSHSPGADNNAPLWDCTELRGDGQSLDGLRSVEVYRQGLSTLTLADFYQAQMAPLGPKKMGTLSCKAPQG